MQSFEVRVPVGDVPGAELAVTVHAPDDPDPRAPLVVAFPGGGYCRGYYNLQIPGRDGYSQAEHHTAAGHVLVAIDHLGVGDSSPVELTSLTFDSLAAANAAVTAEVVERLRTGTLDQALPPLDPARVIGIGQSLGGAILTVHQANHRTFDAVAFLGWSGLQTILPTPPDRATAEYVAPERGTAVDPEFVAASAIAARWGDFGYAFHYDDVPDDIVSADVGPNAPIRVQPIPPWASATTPTCAITALSPGVVAAEADGISVPIFVGAGERDVVPDPWAEPGAYRSSSDVTLAVFARMAHMHNFGSSRTQLWDRLAAWYRVPAR
jgi:dienelactone hydrolase